jgi:hypothetical protein
MPVVLQNDFVLRYDRKRKKIEASVTITQCDDLRYSAFSVFRVLIKVIINQRNHADKK